MSVFLVSFQHPKHNIKASAKIVSTHHGNATAIFRKEFEKVVFHGFYEDNPDIAATFLQKFWEGVEFSCINLETESVFNFSWDRKDNKVRSIFKE